MTGILNEVVENKQFELLIDTEIFSKDVALKAAYNFLDKGYFFFALNADKNLVLQFTAKEDVNEDPKTIIGEFSDELLAVHLRDKLEKDNKVIRETIIGKALLGPIDSANYVSLDTEQQKQDVIDFDKDIDEILKEIEEDPDLKIDEQEIENILKEIEEESEVVKPQVKVDTNAVNDVKDMFKKKK